MYILVLFINYVHPEKGLKGLRRDETKNVM